MPEIARNEWLKDDVTGWVHADGTACPEYLAPPASTPPGGYWCTTHQMFVRHLDSPIILEVSKYDPDVDPQVIAASYQAELIPSSLPRRDRAFLIADEDVTFPEDEQDPLPPGHRRPLSFGEEQADIINATGA